MPGKHLARWTLSWFASALLCLVLALALALVAAPAPGEWRRGVGLALLHLAAIGWLSQAMIGALIQFLPVLLARPLLWPGLSLAALLLTGPGAGLLALGFLGLEGWPPGLTLLAVAPLPLGLAFLLVMTLAAGPLVAARGWRDATGRMVILALVALGLAWLGGAGMARMLAGAGGFTLPADLLPFHVTLGAAGWLGLAAMGVSYRLFAMFLLAPDPTGPLRPATALLALLMIAALALGMARGAAGGAASPALAAMAAAAAVALLYLADLSRLWRSRNRPRPEVNMRMSRPSLCFLALAAGLAPFAIRQGGALAEAAVFAALIGWLSTLTLAQMVKIVSFLTWIQIFAPRIGRGPLPLVQDLVDEPAARRWLLLWLAGAALGTLALLAGQPAAFRAAIACLLIAALGLLRLLWQIRRLARLAPGRHPGPLPPLFLPPQTKAQP
ncbi:hypothetical protein [Paracoccus siganidrum]|uniref:NnrS family protein n=1 Tax=Paracoccus siganidrum TaxID=1276757 RepID=A0A418ZU32_9RHOB|nr:hypothetical protein [Paracoccus siganidrum]RJL01942.1 hypothetical protein D3P05_21975 [Paracoccus siganidrum]RMC35172.1 hypothetical protein C9E82_11215 [Paracoccus siganidrum]